MSIDKRDTGIYRFRKLHQGKQYTMTFYGNEKEAKKTHEDFIYKVRNGDYDRQDTMTLRELSEIVYEDHVKKKLAANSIISYKMSILKINAKLGKKIASEIKPIEVERFLDDLRKVYANGTVKLVYGHLMMIYNRSVMWGLLERNPFIGKVENPRGKPNNNMNELLSMKELSQIIHIYQEKNQYQKAGLYLALGCGLRIAEIRGLKLSDIDFENSRIKIARQINLINGDDIKKEGEKPPKYNSERLVFAPEFVMESIREIVSTRKVISKNGYLFYSTQNKGPVSKCFFYRPFKKELVKNNLPNISFHDLRHMNATLLINEGIDVHSVAKRLGHKNIATTMTTYIHSIDEKDKQVASEMDRRFQEISKMQS